MGDNVKIIEANVFPNCSALRVIRFSKTLEYIGAHAFYRCVSVEALFLPSTIKSIGGGVFYDCESLRLILLPNDIVINDDGDMNDGDRIIVNTAIKEAYEDANPDAASEAASLIDSNSNSRDIEWLVHHMDDSPFHALCYDTFVTAKQIKNHLNENGNDSALQIDSIHGMTPLHMLVMNPHAPSHAIHVLLHANMEAVFYLDNQQKTPLDWYAREYNVGGLHEMIADLCNHRNSSIHSSC